MTSGEKRQEARDYSFGQEGESWFDILLFSLRSRHVLNEIKNIVSVKSVLDIGCGYHATFLQNFKKIRPEVSILAGIDMSVGPIQKEGITLSAADLNMPLKFPDNTFDVAVSTAVFEHLEKPDLAAKEAWRVLKPGGKLIITTPSPAAKPVLEFLAFKLSLIDPTEILDHKTYFSRTGLESLFREAGFKNIKTKYFQFGFNTFAVCIK